MGELSSCEKLRDFGWPNVAALDRADKRGWRRQRVSDTRKTEKIYDRAIFLASKLRVALGQHRLHRELYDNDDSDFPREQTVYE